jgi:hypothetical protein
MNVLQFSLLPGNPFSEIEFWGRQKELVAISRYLLSESPRCCAIIGEDTFGKTTLLQYLSNAQDMLAVEYPKLNSSLMQLKKEFVFVYLNCASYGDEVADMQNLASARFWWDLYDAAGVKLQGGNAPRLTKPKVHADQEYIDTALEIRWELEDLVQNQSCKVAFVLDNFEGVAHLPLRDSEWLRSMARVCTYIVASRDLLYLLYHPTSWSTPSPLWNLFGDPIYLNLPPVEEVDYFLGKASDRAKAENSAWKLSDIEYIRKTAGRHPALLRIACASMFEYRLQESRMLAGKQSLSDELYLNYSIDNSAGPICMQLWQGLARPELRGEPRGTSKQQEVVPSLSLHQRALLDIAKGPTGTKEAYILPELDASEKQKILFDLERRDLIENKGVWQVFSEAMRRFVLKQEPTSTSTTILFQDLSGWQKEMLSLTHQEKKVYDYLKAHRGELCPREDIKWAVWQSNKPTNSALQKIIERIREKIEPDPDNPRYLIAVRGKGYILRKD